MIQIINIAGRIEVVCLWLNAVPVVTLPRSVAAQRLFSLLGIHPTYSTLLWQE